MAIDAAHAVRLRRAETDGIVLDVTFEDGTSARFDRFWLRDNCPADGDRESLFREFSAASIVDDLLVIDTRITHPDELEIAFSDGTVDRLSSGFLRRHSAVDAGSYPTTPWSADHEPDTFRIDELHDGSADHLALLEALVSDGLAVVTGAHDIADTETLAGLLGPIRETDFGRVFDIVAENRPFTPSQSLASLDPHTDDPYRYTPSGMSVLHCIRPSAAGGATIAVDGYAVAESLRASEPTAFDALTEVGVPFVHRRTGSVEQGEDVHLRAVAPIIALDSGRQVKGIRFHERSMAPLDPDPAIAERFYPALARFARAVRSPAFQWTRHLRAGEAIVYDNQRVLHGRTEITDAGGRHLRLCTVDREMAHSRLRRLREIRSSGTECDPVPAGNLA